MKRHAFAIFILFALIFSRAAEASDPEGRTIICENLTDLHNLWEDSGYGEDPNGTERAAWIVLNEQRVYEFIRWSRSDARNSEIWKGPVPENLVAQVHTHPENTDPRPSANDFLVALQVHVPIYIISKDGIWIGMPNGRMKRQETSGWYKRLSSDCKIPQ
jgi:hypothetical protein